MLYGRAREEQQIRTLLEKAEQGSSGSLVIVAEPGVGKSALLEHAASSVEQTWQVLRCTGVECESELPFAGLQLLVAPFMGKLDTLPQTQADAVRGAFGLLGPHLAADRFLVGLGMLTLLAEVSTERPVLCLVDDAQWVDLPSIEALLFAARRLGDERVVILFGGREEFAAQGLPELRLPALDAAAARELLAASTPGLRPEVRDRVLAEAAGNPLALLEMPAMNLDRLPIGPLPLPERLRRGYQCHLVNQPESVRTALLVAAAEETGDLGLVLRVLAGLGLTDEVLAAAEPTGMLVVSEQSITFRHPLRRSAVYQFATFTERRAVHAAIAAALTDDPDRRAWHLAGAASGPDEYVAAALEEAAEHARDRTGYATACLMLERAARLSPDPADRLRRLVLSVEAAADAGRLECALGLIAETKQLTADPVAAARLASVQARIEIDRGTLPVAYELLLGAAVRVAPIDPDMAATMLVEAAHTAWPTGDLAGARTARARLAEISTGPLHDGMLTIIDGPLALYSPDPAAGVRLIRANVAQAMSMCGGPPPLRFTLAVQSIMVCDLDEAREILAGLAAECRDRGMVGWLPTVGCGLGRVELLLGRIREAEATLSDALRIAEDIGQPGQVGHAQSILSIVAAVRGEEERCRDFAAHSLRQADRGFNALIASRAGWALALLDLGYGRHEEALERIEAIYRNQDRAVGQRIHLMSDCVEAAVRLRAQERARDPLDILQRWSAATGLAWIQAHVLRCRAMLEDDGELFAQALTLHAAEGRWFDHARTGLLYGEWLRRERFKTEARTHLRSALETFERLRAEPWAERARGELRAAGVGMSDRNPSNLAALLTSQEFQVVRLAAAGATNKEIAAQLFLSPKTVGNHLYRAYPKLGVTSRVALARLELD
ncbi:LuxR family transcriptional regulator [Nocardia sp. NPDC051030]|uniref:helix-turn-helix transcriptional regulator n=1 Tax=Nocardia sp. NPDC051030 TaxID=3155162 RepID=UPI00344AC75C